MATAALVAAVAFLAPALAPAQDHSGHASPSADWDPERALAFSQAAIGRQPGGHRLTTPEGATLTLESLRGQPLVVSLIYTSCYHTCPVITQTLRRVVEVGDEAFGPGQYHVLTLGFDAPNDTPARMRSYMKQHGIARAGWLAASANAVTVQALASELGFIFFASPKGFDHLAQTTVIDAGGRVYRQVYGEDFAPPALVEPLKELIYGIPAREAGIGGWVAGIKLFCTVYDPKAGRYRFDFTPFISIGFALSIFAALLFIGWRSFSRWSRERRAGGGNQGPRQ